MESEQEDLLRKLEEENGGPVSWKTYAFFLPPAEKKRTTTGGLLYIVGRRLIFEDFPQERSMYSLFIRKKPEYRKLKVHADLATVAGIEQVSQSQALRVLEGKAAPESLSPAGRLWNFFGKTVHMIRFKDGSAWFCEVFDFKGLKKLIEEEL